MSKRAANANAEEGATSKKLCAPAQKKDILENEANATSLAKTKVAYSRRGEEEDTLVVRDLYNATRFDRFGVKGVDQLERVFYIILDALNEHRTTLLKRMRFGGDALRDLLDGLSDSDRDGMRAALDEYDAISSTTKIELKKLETCPQLSLMQYTEKGNLKNGIYLFVSEAMKLVKHMNATFAFSKSKCLSFVVDKQPIDKYTDDHFF